MNRQVIENASLRHIQLDSLPRNPCLFPQDLADGDKGAGAVGGVEF